MQKLLSSLLAFALVSAAHMAMADEIAPTQNTTRSFACADPSGNTLSYKAGDRVISGKFAYSAMVLAGELKSPPVFTENTVDFVNLSGIPYQVRFSEKFTGTAQEKVEAVLYVKTLIGYSPLTTVNCNVAP